MGSNYSDKVIISVGGSLVVPQGGIDTQFLKELNDFIRSQLAKHKDRQFFLTIGGGATTRHYQQAAREVIGHELTDNDLDWIGIHATRLNAQLVRTIFRDIAHPNLIKHYEIIRKVPEPVVVAAGWKPGWSTDYCATLLCEDYHIPTMINMSNITQVYDKDPKTNPDAKPIDHLSWEELRKLTGDTWTPGMNAPFDPIAAKRGQEMGLKVTVLGKDFKNLENLFEGKPYIGTTIE